MPLFMSQPIALEYGWVYRVWPPGTGVRGAFLTGTLESHDFRQSVHNSIEGFVGNDRGSLQALGMGTIQLKGHMERRNNWVLDSAIMRQSFCIPAGHAQYFGAKHHVHHPGPRVTARLWAVYVMEWETVPDGPITVPPEVYEERCPFPND